MKDQALASVIDEIEDEAFSKTADEVDYHDFYKYRISYITDKDLKLLFLFVTGLTDNFEDIKKELRRCRKEFLNLFDDILQHKFDTKTFEVFDPTVDAIHRNLRPKISLIGFSGVGKTTITRLIKAEEIPMQHIPTITGDIATIRIGKLHFHLWDFAGQEQFSYLWSNFIKGSDAALLITDSTLENVEKSKFFLELIKEQAPNAHSAVIANKQDLEKALKPNKIEDILGLKAYSMIAIDPDNRDKMIKIIADILEMNTEISPLLKPLLERDEKMKEAQEALENADFARAADLFEEISDLCIDLGDDSLSQEFYNKGKKIKAQLSGLGGEEKKVVKEELPVEEKEIEEEKVEGVQLLEEQMEEEIQKEQIIEEETLEEEKRPKVQYDEKTIEKPEEIEEPMEAPQEDIEASKPRIKPLPRKEEKEMKSPEPESVPEGIEDKEIPITQPTKVESDLGLKLNPEDFMIKQKPKTVGTVPKDAKKKLKTSAYGHVANPEIADRQLQPNEELQKSLDVKEVPKQEIKKEEIVSPPIKKEIKTDKARGTEPPSELEKPPEEEIQPTIASSLPTGASEEQKKQLKKELMDLKIKKARVSKMGLDFEMQELSGEITAEELHEKKSRLDALEQNINREIKELEAFLKD
ncbi:MAG: ADP-ribosylation factor-like protein [Promethearchaeati archaeon]